jgi:hypothetical protein
MLAYWRFHYLESLHVHRGFLGLYGLQRISALQMPLYFDLIVEVLLKTVFKADYATIRWRWRYRNI